MIMMVTSVGVASIFFTCAHWWCPYIVISDVGVPRNERTKAEMGMHGRSEYALLAYYTNQIVRTYPYCSHYWNHSYSTFKMYANHKDVAYATHNIGAKTYGLLRNLVAPKAHEDKTLDEIRKLLKSHFEQPQAWSPNAANFIKEIRCQERRL